jgi:predicted negative regulator of RcsB-dependent stress response
VSDGRGEATVFERMRQLLASDDVDGAVQLLESTAREPPRWKAALAALNLGRLHHEHGRLDAAAHWYAEALASDDKNAAPQAGFMLGHMRVEAGALAEAEEAFERTLRFRGEAANAASLALAHIMLERGEQDTARRWLRFAASCGDEDVAPAAAQRLGELLTERDNAWGAKLVFERALSSGHPVAAPRAALGLALLHAVDGEWAPARAACLAATAAEDPELVASGSMLLGDVLTELGELEPAADAYRVAWRSRWPVISARAAASLAEPLVAAGQVGAALPLLRDAAAGDDPESAAWATSVLSAHEAP